MLFVRNLFTISLAS